LKIVAKSRWDIKVDWHVPEWLFATMTLSQGVVGAEEGEEEGT
jgi:hypothetical protein